MLKVSLLARRWHILYSSWILHNCWHGNHWCGTGARFSILKLSTSAWPHLGEHLVLMSWLLLCCLHSDSESRRISRNADLCTSSLWDSPSQTIIFFPVKMCCLNPFSAFHLSSGFRKNEIEKDKQNKWMRFIIFPQRFVPPEVWGNMKKHGDTSQWINLRTG